jgi:NADH:ubiquinone oxidoreductase subunit E
MALEFSPEALKQFEATVARYPKKEAAMLPVLYLAQKFGHRPGAIEYVARLMEQSPARVHGVVSFYTMYNMKPIGRHHIQVCRTLSWRWAARRGLPVDQKARHRARQTTADGGLRFRKSNASCGTAPMMQSTTSIT